LFNTYWSAQQRVFVAGYNPPSFDLPDNFTFISIADKDFPAQKWTNGMIHFLEQQFREQLFVWLLEDYWLTRTVDVGGVATLADYVQMHPKVLRLDLTTDRLYNGQMFDVESFGHYDILETPYKSPYQMSLQAGIWRRSHLLRVLVRGRTPWQTEIDTRPPRNMRVLGTRQYPVRYLNAFKGEDPTNPLNLSELAPEHLENVLTMIPDSIRENVKENEE
jgi:hypothetical protein